MIEKLERLAAAHINLLPALDVATHFVFERDGFVALVERTPDNQFGAVGAAGRLTENGFAALVWRGPDPVFVGKRAELAASESDVAGLRLFQRDLEAALR